MWVPIDGINVEFKRYDFGSYWSGTFDDYSDPHTQELTNITESVTNNGGFYIARYEAGKPIGVKLKTDGSVKSVSKQGASVWNDIAWSESNTNDDANPGNGAVKVARSMYPEYDTNYGAVSTLIYGAQWDTALKFIGEYGGNKEYATNSTGMGNYNGTVEGDPTDATPATSGSSDTFRQKNIYDMAGNVYEWTMEKYSIYRVHRGGDCYDSGSGNPASRRSDYYMDSSDPNGRF